MSDYREPRLVQVARSTLRYRIAAGCAAIAIVLIFFANRFQISEFLSSAPVENRGGHTYSRLWFDANESLVGVTQQGAKLTVDRWSGGGSGAGSWHFDLSGLDPQWIMAADLSRVAWISGSSVYCRAGTDPATVSIALPPQRSVLALGMPSDGSLVAVFADAGFERWDAATGRSLGGRQLQLKDADQAVIEGDYAAISSSREAKLLLYRLWGGEDWKLVEESPAPDPPYRLIIPAAGLMATFTPAGLKIGGETRNSPGALRSAISRVDNVIAAGDFDGVFVLPSKGAEFYKLADGAPGSIVSASRMYLAVSGPHGTALFRLVADNRLTPTGRGVSGAGIGLLILAALLACSGLILDASAIVFKTKHAREARVSGKLDNPPPDLVRACAAGHSVLWAGAGLSAQSGFPLRANFIATILQIASVEKWVDAARERKLRALLVRGAAESALNEVVAGVAPIRNQVIETYRGIFSRYLVLSRSHEMLARMPFAAAITTNYDVLIERMGEHADISVITLRSPAQTAQSGFLLKLYGQLSAPQTMLLCRAEFELAIARSEATATLRQVFETRSVLFVGCSLEGLLADLSHMDLPDKPVRKHFAIAGVSNPAWETQAAELKQKYGIEVLACKADTIGEALPEFLQKLATQVEQTSQGVVQTEEAEAKA